RFLAARPAYEIDRVDAVGHHCAESTSGITIRLPPALRPIAVMRLSSSVASPTPSVIGSTPSERAIGSNALRKNVAPPGVLLGLNITAACLLDHLKSRGGLSSSETNGKSVRRYAADGRLAGVETESAAARSILPGNERRVRGRYE